MELDDSVIWYWDLFVFRTESLRTAPHGADKDLRGCHPSRDSDVNPELPIFVALLHLVAACKETLGELRSPGKDDGGRGRY